jgi:hypothetical protein
MEGSEARTSRYVARTCQDRLSYYVLLRGAWLATIEAAVCCIIEPGCHQPKRLCRAQNEGYYNLLEKVLAQLQEELPDAKYDKGGLAQLLWLVQQFMEDSMGKNVSKQSSSNPRMQGV